jgi:hypothetical protein
MPLTAEVLTTCSAGSFDRQTIDRRRDWSRKRPYSHADALCATRRANAVLDHVAQHFHPNAERARERCRRPAVLLLTHQKE